MTVYDIFVAICDGIIASNLRLISHSKQSQMIKPKIKMADDFVERNGGEPMMMERGCRKRQTHKFLSPGLL